ncbi:PREDICTED: 39S ribosomal protein L18, mitochondrial-like [Amphimedon queenslandica]|uniref:Large ribosomal subunit protein uL18m n=2 Tax=Amphimedon queenslandica TaxID=400682 RepID=A0AAN0J060_AMPQE|nr:PREDICTED: 39S ribosomal protein L18, mitochondrial-like [Amphimedon queenslandica]|eukprot:XP_019850098.1 PREDICTED: 39S ribosomal protein L18, mitochondrial-like [Amphimedon queenslandica]
MAALLGGKFRVFSRWNAQLKLPGERHISSEIPVPGLPEQDKDNRLAVSGRYRNRNPRNFELLGMAKKPRGFVTSPNRVDYYHRLNIVISNRHISAYVNHNNGFKVLESSTREFSIAKHLYKTYDVAAAYNIGRVLADRCKDTGIYRLMWDNKRKNPKN